MDGTASYQMEYSGPVAVLGAAVVAFGDLILVHAQDARLTSSVVLSHVTHEFTNVGTVDMTAQIVEASPSTVLSFCAGDGLDPLVTTPCPCGNTGSPGNGCSHSTNSNGARLFGAGPAEYDAVVLVGSGMPATVSCIYLQGDGLTDTVFGDGVRCAGGTLLRLRARTNVNGVSSFPDSTDTVTLSQRGGVVPGSGVVRRYQTYYRNAAAAFCPPATFNATNGVEIGW
jgi:hypothetical protein